MNVFSSGNKYKNAAQSALAQAAYYKNEQSDVDFRRGLLSNIRQERIARAMIEQGEYSDDISSSSTAGAIANIDSSLAGETHYAYDTTARTQKIQDLNQYASEMYRKYQKQQKKRGTAIQLTAIAAGALGGAALAAGGALSGIGIGGATATATGASSGLVALQGGVLGASFGQSVGNFATGNTQAGTQGLINTGAMAYNMGANAKLNATALDKIKSLGATHVAESLDETGKVIPGSREYIYPDAFAKNASILRMLTLQTLGGSNYTIAKGCFNG